MEWIGVLCLAIMLIYSSYPNKVKNLETKLKKIEKNRNGDNYMSKIISELIGKRCIIETDEISEFIVNPKIQCTILDVDDEWVKLTFTDKNNIVKTKIIRIASVDNVELFNE